MRILVVGQKCTKTETALKKVKSSWGFEKLEWQYEKLDMSKLPWEEYGNGKQGIARSYLKTLTGGIFKRYGYDLDAVILYVPKKDWKGVGVLGWGMGELYNSYGVIQTKERTDLYETIEHELWHLLNSYKTMFNGWDSLAVHGSSPEYGEWRADLKQFYYKTKGGDYSHTFDILRKKHGKDYAEAIQQRKANSEKSPLAQTVIKVVTAIVATPKPVEPNGTAPQKTTKLLPLVERRAQQFIANAATLGFTLRITSGFRSFEEQDAIYAQGRTLPGKIVTNARGGESLHNYGVAIDVVDRYKGYDIDWNLLGDIGKECEFEWGGDWTGFVDRPHFELTLGYSLKDFQEGKVVLSKYI